jgi:tetratricopeptide (TPR) repeat protein
MIKTEHGETYSLHSDEIQTIETSGLLDANVCIQDRQGNKLDLIPFIVVPGELAIEKEDKEQMMVYESYTGKTVKFFSPEGTEKLTSGKILERLNLLLRDKQNEKLYNPETFTKEIFINKIKDENKRILTTFEAEKKIIPGVYVHRQDIEIKLREWIGTRSSIFIIAAEAGSGKTNLMVEMQKQYEERNLNTLFIRAGRMDKTKLVEQISYQLNLEIASGIESYSSLSGTQSNPTFFLIDGINESSNAESLWLEIFNLSRLFVPGSIKFVVTIRANSMVDITRYTISDEDLKLVYKDNNEFENGTHSYTFWLRNLNMVEMKLLWDNYSKKKDSIYIPRFSFEDIAYFDRKIYDQISNPLVMRIFLEVYNKKNLFKKGSRHTNLWEDWYNTFSKEERNFLELLAHKVWNIGKNELLLDDLLKSEELKYYLSSDSIKAPYQRLKNLGWVSRYIKDMSIRIGFTVEGMLSYIIGNQLQNRTPKIDTDCINKELKKGNKLKINCIEAFLKLQAVNGDMSLITSLIDEGEEDLDISITPLFQFMKIYGVDKTLQLLLEKVTDNSWKVLIKLNYLLDKLQEHILRKKFLEKIIRYIQFKNKYDTELGLEAIKVIDIESARPYYSKIDHSQNFIQNNSELLYKLGKYEENYLVNYEKSLFFYSKSVAIEEKELGEEELGEEDLDKVVSLYMSLGIVLLKKSENTKSKEYFQKCINILLKNNSKEDLKDSTIFNTLASILDREDEVEINMELYYHKKLEAQLEKFGEFHLDVFDWYIQIGKFYSENGDFNKAFEFYNKSHDIIAKILDVDNLKLSIYNEKMAALWFETKEYDKAIDCCQKSIDIKTKTLGEEHPDIASLYWHMSRYYGANGDFEKELELMIKSINTEIKLFGESNLLTASKFKVIGLIYTKNKKFDKALEYLQKCLEIQIKTFGENNLEITDILEDIGRMYQMKNEWDIALEFSQKSHKIKINNLGEDNLKIADSYNNLGFLYELKSENDLAIEYYKKVLGITLKILGSKHLDTASSFINIGRIFFKNEIQKNKYKISNKYSFKDILRNKNSNYDFALEYFKKGLNIHLIILGYEHLELAEIYKYIGRIYEMKKKFKTALKYFQKSLEIELKNLGEGNIVVSETFNCISKVFNLIGKYEIAIELAQKSLEIQIKNLGENHQDLAISYYNLGIIFLNVGNYINAKSCHEKCFEIRKKQFGINHELTIESIKDVKFIYKILDDEHSFRKWFEKNIENN